MEWISVEERLPEMEQEVLWINVVSAPPMYILGRRPGNGSAPSSFIHWMPLPDPPEEK